MNRLLSINKVKIGFIIIILTYSVQRSVAQSNLVLNPSFELHHDTVDGIFAFDRSYVTDWSDPNSGSSDLFAPNTLPTQTIPPNNAFGFEYPHSGLCYAGFSFYEGPTSIAYEYVQASFTSPLIAGKTYGIESYVSSASDGGSVCVSDLGFYFSDTQMHVDTSPFGERIPAIPQFENPPTNIITTYRGWQRITGSYTAHGGERYMCVGNFKPYSMAHVDTCGSFPGAVYLFIDDVAVYDTAGVDTILLCAGDSLQLGNVWRHSEGLYFDTVGELPVKFYLFPRPQSVSFTILYRPFEYGDSVRISVLQAEGIDSIGLTYAPNYIYIKNDTSINIPMFNIYGCDSTVRYICGWHIDVGKELRNKLDWQIYPNPAKDILQIKLSANDPSMYLVKLMDIRGHVLLEEPLINEQINVSRLQRGMYFVNLVNTKTGTILGTKKVVERISV